MKLICQEVAIKPSESPTVGWHRHVKIRLFPTDGLGKKKVAAFVLHKKAVVKLASTIG